LTAASEDRKDLATEDPVAAVASGWTEVEAGHVFWVRSVHDIFRKVYREKRRFERAQSDPEGMSDQVDAAINFAITAWHVTDWVWAQHEGRLREHFHVNSIRDFQAEIRRRCPGLAVCDVIANAAKHGGVAHARNDRPDIETILIAQPLAKDADGIETVVILNQHRWSLMIEVDTLPHNPHELFNRIFLFWHRFIQQYCLIKG
jgi:hypothetical protein